jgi:2-polyprenyl-6-methoxyphenol hydroxylase-like FAD-dependent oxidoreductase
VATELAIQGVCGQYLHMRALVVGAGPAGCGAALMLARRGHDVVLVDRDEPALLADEPADAIFERWDRPGIGQFRQPHNFLGRGRALLRAELPDLYNALLAAGAGEVRQDAFLGDAPREPADEALAVITCRRPIIDATLHAAVAREPKIGYRAGAVSGLTTAGGAIPRHVTGVELSSGETVTADLVVDASGRNSAVHRWLAAAGAHPWPTRTVDSKLLYYSRHYRFRDEPLPYASILGGPRGDIGYLAFAVFIGDNRTFCLCIMAPAWEKEWRALRDEGAFERVAHRLPGAASWLDAAEPITPVLPMGQLRNVLREPVRNGTPLVTGLVPIGDARCHTNPTFALGLSLGLTQAVALADAVDTARGDADLSRNFDEAVGEDAATRYEAVGAEDRDRVRLWSGEPIDVTDRNDSMPFFLRTVVYRAAAQDAELLRAVCRRINGLDPIDALAANTELLDRAAKICKELEPTTAPARAQMLAALHG